MVKWLLLISRLMGTINAITILTIIIELWVCFTPFAGFPTLTPTKSLKVRSSEDLRLTDFSNDG